jgi:tetratricopeptide (TPR) repeat protein
LAEHSRVFTGDRTAIELLSAVRWLKERLEELSRGRNGQLDALCELGPFVPPGLIVAWHARVAELAERERGADARFAGDPAGFHWLSAANYGRAIASLRRTLEQAPGDGRARAYFADALFLSGDREAARREYWRAFRDDPLAIALSSIADPEVARLIELVRHGYELGQPAAPWVPAVGVVERVFPPPSLGLPAVAPPLTVDAAPPRAFVDLIALERSSRTLDDRVAIRRRMKALAPLLFDAYLRALA